MTEIQTKLKALADEEYKSFQSRLMPTVAPDKVLGVRTPALRALARELKGTCLAESFLNELPHIYYEEDNLHAYLIEQIGDIDECIAALDRFLPFVDNWATCDTMHPKVLKKHTDKLLSAINRWIASPYVYEQRFGIGMLMAHFLDDDFKPGYLEKAARIHSEEYYIKMMVAWYFATALAKQYEATLPFIENRRLDTFTHNKAIQKAIESYRVASDHKAYLKTLKKSADLGQSHKEVISM